MIFEDHLVKEEPPEIVERDDLFTNLTCGEDPDSDQDFDVNSIKIEVVPLLIPNDVCFQNSNVDSTIPFISYPSSSRFEGTHRITAGVQNSLDIQPNSIPDEKFILPSSTSFTTIKHEAPDFPAVITCLLCKETFNTRYELILHDRIHTGERPYKCSLCEKTFTRSGALKNHQKVHSLKEERNKSSFTNSSDLKSHKRSHFREKKSYQCSFCEKTFGNPENMKTHERVHTGEKPLKCSFCELTFSSNISRGTHEIVHKELSKSYMCSIV